MARKYDSTRRKEAAAETRRRILQAALKLHWNGVTAFEPLAAEAGCSVATVRKYFPTREFLFRNCTRTFAETLTFPDLGALEQIADPDERLARCVSELCRIHEAMFGYAWLSAHLREESPTLDSEMKGYEGLADAIARIVVPGDGRMAAVVRSLLDFLTYRALRLSGDLSPEEARDEILSLVQSSTHAQERPKP